MQFKITTSDIQKTVIALINSECCAENTIITRADYERLKSLFCDMNKLCSEANNWTLSVTVE